MSEASGGGHLPPSPAGPPGRLRRRLMRLAFYATFAFVGLPLAFSELLLRGARQRASPPPPGYEAGEVVSEGLRLRTWRARGSGRRAGVVLVHGLGDTLESYVDHADVLRRRGHGVLLLDLRAHGASEGRYTTLGAREREDVRAAMAALRRGEGPGKGLVLMGVSMGAVAALRAAAGEAGVEAVVVEAPYDGYRETVTHHAWLLYRMPSWFPLIPLSIAAAEWRGGFDADEVDAVAAAARIRAPLLAIVDGDDPRMPEPVVRRIVEAHPGPHRVWVAPGAPHAGAVLHPDYWEVVLSFLDFAGV